MNDEITVIDAAFVLESTDGIKFIISDLKFIPSAENGEERVKLNFNVQWALPADKEIIKTDSELLLQGENLLQKFVHQLLTNAADAAKKALN